MIVSPTTREFLARLIQGLEHAECRPIVLRNYEKFPTEIGNDLDVYVSPERLEDAYSILASGVFERGGKIAHIHRRGYFVAIWLQFPDCEAPVHIDLYHGALTWHGLSYLRERELESKSQAVGTGLPYRIPAPWHEALVSLLASILWGGFFKDRYQGQLSALLSDPTQRQAFTAHLEHTFGRGGSLLAAAVTRNEVASMVDASFSRRLRQDLWIHSLKASPLASGRNWLWHWFEEFACYGWRLPGMVVEYDETCWQAHEVDQLRERLGLYFGEVHSIGRQHAWFSRNLRVRRMRGKNHLVLLRGRRFAINGNACIVKADLASSSVASIAKAALDVLARRIEFLGGNQ